MKAINLLLIVVSVTFLGACSKKSKNRPSVQPPQVEAVETQDGLYSLRGSNGCKSIQDTLSKTDFCQELHDRINRNDVCQMEMAQLFMDYQCTELVDGSAIADITDRIVVEDSDDGTESVEDQLAGTSRTSDSDDDDDFPPVTFSNSNSGVSTTTSVVVPVEPVDMEAARAQAATPSDVPHSERPKLLEDSDMPAAPVASASFEDAPNQTDYSKIRIRNIHTMEDQIEVSLARPEIFYIHRFNDENGNRIREVKQAEKDVTRYFHTPSENLSRDQNIELACLMVITKTCEANKMGFADLVSCQDELERTKLNSCIANARVPVGM